MFRKRVTCVSAIAVAVGVSALTAGVGLAAAQPGAPCGPKGGTCQGPGSPGGPNWGPPPPDLAWRGLDQGRYDHQPFNYDGSWVQPLFNPDFNDWGLWFFGIWIPL